MFTNKVSSKMIIFLLSPNFPSFHFFLVFIGDYRYTNAFTEIDPLYLVCFVVAAGTSLSILYLIFIHVSCLHA